MQYGYMVYRKNKIDWRAPYCSKDIVVGTEVECRHRWWQSVRSIEAWMVLVCSYVLYYRDYNICQMDLDQIKL
jgi:hypothetical protein